MVTVGLWIGLIGCMPGGPPPVVRGDRPGGGDTTDSGFANGDSEDEQIARRLIAGDEGLEFDSAINSLVAREGLPVRTNDGTVIFLREGDVTGWGVAGDFKDWTPAPLVQGDGFGWLEVAIPGDLAGRVYKFTDGTAWEEDPFARSYRYDENGAFSYVAPPTDTWRLDRWPHVDGQGMSRRTVRVYVPPGDGPFPVIYAQDGQNLFNPGAPWGGWQLPSALDKLADPVLVVGIDNTSDRMFEYTHVKDTVDGFLVGGDGDAYADFVFLDVATRVQEAYPVGDHVGVMGSSLGGLISLQMGLRYPAEVDVVLALSPTLGWGRYGDPPKVDMTDLYLAAGPTAGQLIYVDSGGSDGGDGCTDPDGDGSTEDDPNSRDNYCVTRAFADALAANGWTWDESLLHWHELNATHDEAAWAARVNRPLQAFLDAR